MNFLSHTTELTERFVALSADTTDQEFELLADDIVAMVGPNLGVFTSLLSSTDLGDSADLISDHLIAGLSDPQRRALEVVSSKIERLDDLQK